MLNLKLDGALEIYQVFRDVLNVIFELEGGEVKCLTGYDKIIKVIKPYDGGISSRKTVDNVFDKTNKFN